MQIKVLVGLGIGLIANCSFSQTTIVLDSCQLQAQKNYPLIKQYELIDKTAEFTLSNANKAYLPQFNITTIWGAIFSELAGSDSPNFKWITYGQLRQTLWDGGATQTQKKIIKDAAAVDRANVEVQLHAIRERVNQLFFGVLVVDEQLKLLKAQIDLLNKNFNHLKALNASGMTIKNDLNMVQAEILRIEQKRTEFAFTRKSYLSLLSAFTATNLPENTILQRPVLQIAKEANHPELKLFANQTLWVESQSAMNKVGIMPKVGIMGTGAFITPGINFGGKGGNSVALAGLSMSWELSSLYTNSNNKQLLQLNKDKIVVQQETFLFNNRLQRHQTNTEIEKYQAFEHSDAQIVALRRNIRENYQKQYDSGSCSFNDWLTASEKETEAAATQALHQIQLLVSLYQFNYLTGN